MATRQRICRVQILRLSRVLADAFLARFVLMLWLARLADICQAMLCGLARLANICQAVLCGLARLDDICRAVLRGLARLARFTDTHWAVLPGLARLARFTDTHWAVLPGLARLANTRFGEFLRNMWLASTHSLSSGHCLSWGQNS
jgi:hypothetical protein